MPLGDFIGCLKERSVFRRHAKQTKNEKHLSLRIASPPLGITNAIFNRNCKAYVARYAGRVGYISLAKRYVP